VSMGPALNAVHRLPVCWRSVLSLPLLLDRRKRGSTRSTSARELYLGLNNGEELTESGPSGLEEVEGRVKSGKGGGGTNTG